MKHLSAEDIQKYLDSSVDPEAAELGDHLSVCTTCRKRVEDYRALYVELADDRAITPIQDLPHKVMNRLEARHGTEHESALLDCVLAGLGALLAAVALTVFVGLGPLGAGLGQLGAVVRSLANGVGGIRPAVIVSAAIVIVIVYVANGIVLSRSPLKRRRT